MKWLSATAVFAAVLPSITVFSEPLSKELNSSYRGSGLSASDSSSKNFTQQTKDDSGTTYTITGDVSFTNFTNIPEAKSTRVVEPAPTPPPSPAPDTQSSANSSKQKSESKLSTSIGYESAFTQPQEQLYHSPDDQNVTSFASHVLDGDQGIFDIGKFTDEKPNSLGFSLSSASSPAVTTSTTDASTSTPVPKGGGAFYNDKTGPITFITHAGNPGSLSCTLIRMTGQGGAIYSKGPISFDGLENLTFQDDLSQQAGGALFTDSTLTIRNILNSIAFTNNAARVPIPLIPVLPQPAAESGIGGLVPPKFKETHLFPRYFSQEAAVKEEGTQTPTFPTYTTETAGNGGAIFAKGAIVISTYKDMTFRGNSAEFPLIIDVIKEKIDAQKKAAALPSASERVQASAEVAKQQPQEAPPVIKGSGGAIFGLDTITIRDGSEDTLFILNTATGAGGAIYGDKDISLNNIANLRFQSNSADTRGGAIYSKGNLTIQDSTILTQFNANNGKTGGGAIYSLGNVTLTNLSQVRFGVNKAGNYDLKITIPDTEASAAQALPSSVAKQSAPVPIVPPLGKGGGIYVEKALTVSNITSILEFINNQATDHGGGVYVKGALNCSNSHRIQFTTNTSKKSGGGLYCESDVTFTNLTGKTLFQGNTAEENGGGICLADQKSLNLSNLENFCLVDNTTKKSGGGAYIPKALSFTFSNPDTVSSTTPGIVPVFGSAVITGNTATENGGGVYTAQASLTNLKSIDIGQNSAKNGAGLCTTNATGVGVAGIAAQSADDLDFKVDYVVTANVTENNATESGGGVYGKKGKISRLDYLNITGNSAGTSGGGLYFTEALTLEGIEISNISDNTAKESGGAIYAKALTCTNFPDGLTVSNNKAQVTSTTRSEQRASSVPANITGGAFSAETLILKNLQGSCTFSGNKAIDDNKTVSSDSSADPNIHGGAIYAQTSFTLQNSSGSLTFSGNSATTKRSTTTGQIAGGAIYAPTVTIENCSQPINFVGNSALCTPEEQPAAEVLAKAVTQKATFGGAIAGTTSITFTGNQALFFKENSADNGSAIGCKNGSNGTVTFSDPVFCSFEGNIAKNRGAIYADTLSIPQGYMNFSNNSSANDGSAIYFTKKADITAAASIVFLDNTVTLAQTPAQQRSQVNNLGAAIYGEGNGSTDAELNLTALGGSITFKNNQCAPAQQKVAPSFCSITGKVKLTLNAAANQSINFYDAVRTQTVKSSSNSYETLDINKTSNGGNPTKYTGTVLFSSEYHENKSVIPQKVVLHDGTLILGKNTELNVASFDQKPGSSLVMGPGAVLSTQQKSGSGATGGIAINNLTIDFSDIVSEDGTASPPALKLGVAPAAAAVGPRARMEKNDLLPRANVSNPDVTQEKVYLTGTITLIDPAGTFYQNPYLGEDRQIELLKLPDSSKVEISNLTLEGDTKPLKGYIGSWTLGSGDQNGTLKANWKFEEYRRWIYIPRDNYFYVNSILGSQNSLIAVKQGIVNNMLNNARFDDAAYNNLWLCGIGSFLQKEQGEESRSFSYHSRGYSLAIDAKPRPEFILGASFSQVFGHAKSEKAVDNYKHKGSDHSFQGTLYTGKAFYLPYKRTKSPRPILFQGVMTYGYMKHDTTTYYPSIHERNLGNWEDLGWLFDIRMILDLKEPSQNSTTRFSFYSEAEYIGVRQKQFTELDYDPRTFDSFAYRNLSIPLGFVFEGALMQYDILMYNKLSLAYVPVIYRNKPKCNYRVNSTGQTGQVYGVIPTRNTGRAEYSSQIYLGPYWTLYGTYTVEAGMSSLVQMANCGARMIF
ncbi:autotransporter beta-domain protein [Chlamydia psittaci 09DC78]|uniref:polymorphic outer membrane protein middle domain-containing protein n=1 Tax=Chlamydia psittaci TaxID=83554 RepID=UPI0003529C2B|nr:polymorphic outer membrane protein middle domain-containing protein [Chlamydia psittaci]EPJ25274.1 autotransporter beta-domain protein [Chlamydia psittaci 09DC77]EPJ26662.1 autotransporter beta-domain protein [Chlamydia psittaci 09DC80]EPJ30542.1 autotransporter beta-domain protein [Chlamydia psittaci 09DC78]EPL01580.1 autotransporter beta-domain protein [Chlamydia psittaci 09DC79]